MRAIKNFLLKKIFIFDIYLKIFDRILATAKVISFSKVDFHVIVQKKKARVSRSGILVKIEKTYFSMKSIVTFIVSFLGFVSNNKKSARKLNV